MMEEGTGFATFAVYNAIHLHFTSSSYDYFKYNGKTNVSKDSFLKRNDKYHFHKLARKYSLEEVKYFYISNFIESDFKWVGDIIGEEGEQNYKKWLKRNQSLTYNFENELRYMFDQVKSPEEVLKVLPGKYPKLLMFTMEGHVCIETLCILNDIMNFFPMWTKKITDDIIWPSWKKKVERYTPFIDYNKNKYKTILKEVLKDYEDR